LRRRQQAVLLPRRAGRRHRPEPYGKLPLIDKDPARPALSVAMRPSWGRWVNSGRNDESLLRRPTPGAYCEFLGKRYGKKGVIWTLGGDRTLTGFEATCRALAKGIAIGAAGKEDYGEVLMSFHPARRGDVVHLVPRRRRASAVIGCSGWTTRRAFPKAQAIARTSAPRPSTTGRTPRKSAPAK
jgi:hypothetical protein